MNATATEQLISSEQLLSHWQGHRGLTRKVITAFPENELFNYSIGGMRPFAQLAMELLAIAGPGLKEIVSGETGQFTEHFDSITTKEQLLEKWDSETEVINSYYRQISPERFHESVNLFGQYNSPAIESILYFIDNEIHHRGQGYVYLRSLNIEPPAFWDK